MSKDDFFGINCDSSLMWKSKKFYMCQSGNQLWIALTLMQYRGYDNSPTREEYKKVMKSIPYPPHPTCKCKDCRYHRLVYGK